MGSSDNDVAVPAVPVNEPPFSIRNYVLAARYRNISRNWPFPEKYLQTCMIHGVSKVLPPFDSHKSVKNIVHRREENSNCINDVKSDIVSIRKNCVGLDRGKEIIEVNCNVSTSNTNPKPHEEMDVQCLTAVASSSKRLNSNGQEENLICVKDVKSDIASVQKNCVDRERGKEVIEVNGYVSTSNSNPRSNVEEEEKSSCVEDMILDIDSVQKNCIALNREEEIIEGSSNVGISDLKLRSNEEENSDIDSIQKNCEGFNHEEEIIEINSNVTTTSNSNPKSSEEMDEQCLKAAASCSKRLNSKQKKRKRKAKKRLVADVVADAKLYTLEELDKINGPNWAIDQRVIYRRITSRTHRDEVNGTKETTAINDIREAKSAERFRKTKQHGKDNNTAENDSSVVEKRPALVSKFKHRKPQSPKVEVNTPIKMTARVNQ